ncbi:MAG TPA: hypothetical protein VMU51_03690, partial [Mycobacteriales bacterium]|nr:hypothetical protein [Mycobacteriales bacterium]
MPFDPDTYRRQVLEPARAGGNVPPPDLLLRYALTHAELAGAAPFDRHVDQVVRHWRALKQQRAFAKLADALLAGHAELQRSGELTPAALRERSAAARDAARRRLGQQVAALAAAFPYITSGTGQALVDGSAGLLDAATVRDALRAAQVRVVEPWPVPATPPTAKARDLARNLGLLGCRLSVEAVFGPADVRAGFRLRDGFRLASGAALTTEAVRAAQREVDKGRADERKTAASTVLAVLLDQLARPDGVEALLRWELATALEPQAAAGMPARVLAADAADLGLDPVDAGTLAVSLLAAVDERRVAGAGEIAELLGTGQLRAAQQRLQALPPGRGADVREQVEATAARVDARAAAAAAATDPEQAAALLGQAIALAQDDEDLGRQLAAIPPPPPVAVAVAVTGDGVLVSWRPGPARVGAVRHRVVRTLGRPAAAATEPVALGEVAGRELTDPAPPPGETLRYTVFAAREPAPAGEPAWSAGTAGPAVTVLPEVDGLQLEADDRSVSASWRLPAGAIEVEVWRGDAAAGPAGPGTGGLDEPARGGPGEPTSGGPGPGGPGGAPSGGPDAGGPGGAASGGPGRAASGGPAERRVAAGAAGFTDRAVRTGQRYRYRISTVYFDRSGARLVSPGLVGTAAPDVRPVPVDDLAAEAGPDGRPAAVRLTWTPPRTGAVGVRIGDRPPPWPAGSTIALADLAGY